MKTILESIFESKRRCVDQAKRSIDTELLKDSARTVRANSGPLKLRSALQKSGVNIIAEFKRASPSKGVINDALSADEAGRQYETGGACGMSVLTEEDFFAGSLTDLETARGAVTLPILRKDFIFDGFQVYEAAAAGADAVLLIASALDTGSLADLLSLTEDELKMDALVEVHTQEEMTKAKSVGATLIGVNNRDLRTFEVSLDVSRKLIEFAPPNATLVSESGLSTRGDLLELQHVGYSGFLIGEALMRSGDPVKTLRDLTRPEHAEAV